MSALTLFDYADLQPEVAQEARAAAERIRVRMRRTAEDIVEIGRDLIAVKASLPHGAFGPWLEEEFDMGLTAARRFMNVAQRFPAKSATMADITATVLYELAAPSTPDEVVAQVEARAAAGETVTVEEVKALKRVAADAQAALVDAEKRALAAVAQTELLTDSLENHKRKAVEEIEARFAQDLHTARQTATKRADDLAAAQRKLAEQQAATERAIAAARAEVEEAAKSKAEALAQQALARKQSDLDRAAKAEQVKKDAVARLEQRERELQALIDQHNEWRAKNGAKDVEEQHLQTLIDGAIPTLADLLVEIESRTHDHEGRVVAMAATVAGYCDKLAAALRSMGRNRLIDLDAA